MGLNDVHSVVVSGKWQGVPVAISWAYQQVLADAPGLEPGRELVIDWFTFATGPWFQIRTLLSEDLVWECAVDAYGSEVETIFLTDAMGLDTTASLPTTHALQVNIPAEFPHNGAHEGRFYLPGMVVNNVNRSSYDDALNSALVTMMAAMLEVGDRAGEKAFRLVPHGNYLDALGGTDQINSWIPYVSPFVKVIGSRRADQCGAFTGGSGAGFDPVIVPPPGP